MRPMPICTSFGLEDNSFLNWYWFNMCPRLVSWGIFLFMNIAQRAKRDIERITSNPNGGGHALLFTAPSGETAAVYGRFSKITLPNEQGEGAPVNSLQTYVSVSEKFLTDLAYPVRNSDGIVHMEAHTVEVADSTGTTAKYAIVQWHPDETVGLIVFILSNYEEL